MGRQAACRIDPQVVAQLNHGRECEWDDLISVTLVFRDDLKPRPPFTVSAFKRFDRMVQDVFDRVNEKVGEDDDAIIPNVETYHSLADLGAYALTARVRFIDELVKQPELAECLTSEASIDLPDPDPDGIGLDLD